MTLSLASVFAAIAAKRLALVDLPKHGSNQHELNGSARLREFFSEEMVSGDLQWHYFAEGDEPAHAAGTFTFYDSRLKSADRTGRSEWRMYYTGDFLARAAPGDLLILARTRSEDIHALVFEGGSSWMRSAQVLFEVDSDQRRFEVIGENELDRHTVEFVSAQIIDELQLDIELPQAVDVEALAERELRRARAEGLAFPSAARMAVVARETVMTDLTDADSTLLRWLETEEQVFRAVERLVVEVKLQSGFAGVDDFIKYSLSVQNRRKSRMGLALQNHLAEIFRLKGLRFDAQAFTENRKRPDFLFPGTASYHDPTFDPARLTMLAAKSSCKERWTQVLTEATRIPTKHLCTLETSISHFQMEEMRRQGVLLVIPAPLHATYTSSQLKNTHTLHSFIEFVRGIESLTR
ncbi:MAG TPA: type II restriction endonuclease [Thermoanaerobaculia bacterium]|jgi:hypothetical protein|nr:type II restriction endonuclease [Thermoanaerobaculia bacterium]